MERPSLKHPTLKLVSSNGSEVAEARNTGLSKASGQVIVMYTGHAYASGDFLSVLVVRLMECNSEVVGVGCRHIVAPDDRPLSRAFGTATRSAFGGFKTTHHQADVERYADSLAFTAYWHEVFQKLGGYDPMGVNNEDGEFNLRVKRARYKLLYTPTTVVYHHEAPSTSAFLRKMFRYGAARARTILKHPWSFKPKYAAPSAAVLAALLLFVGGLLNIQLFLALRALIAAYAVCSFLSAAKITGKIGRRYIPAVMLAFSIIHTGYGVGFIAGIFQRGLPSNRNIVYRHTRPN